LTDKFNEIQRIRSCRIGAESERKRGRTYLATIDAIEQAGLSQLPIIDIDPARFDEPLQAIPLNITTDDDFDFYGCKSRRASLSSPRAKARMKGAC
jgi:hypothetical protein